MCFVANDFINALLHSAEDATGDVNDVRRLCKQIMNKAVSKRIISKQEACLLLADMKLTACTEVIDPISISNSRQVAAGDINQSTSKKTFVELYQKRDPCHESLSLHSYYYVLNDTTMKDGDKLKIPHFCGINGVPKFPVTESYARHTLIIHRPWREYPNLTDWLSDFEVFINSDECPVSARLAYDRVMMRHYDKMTHYEPKATEGDHLHNRMSEEDMELQALCGLKGDTDLDHDDALLSKLPRGLNHAWSVKPKVSYCNHIM